MIQLVSLGVKEIIQGEAKRELVGVEAMKVAVVFGPPGAGKGTQCGLLAERRGVVHVSTGAILRTEAARGSAAGEEIRRRQSAGELLSDDLLFASLKGYLKGMDFSGKAWLLLDGVPRTLSQVPTLDETLEGFRLRVDRVIALEADTEALVERFSKRWTCQKCSAVSSFDDAKIAGGTPCSRCGGVYVRREDDQPEVIRRRMEVYRSETLPIREMYEKREIVSEIDALAAVEDVYKVVDRSLVS